MTITYALIQMLEKALGLGHSPDSVFWVCVVVRNHSISCLRSIGKCLRAQADHAGTEDQGLKFLVKNL